MAKETKESASAPVADNLWQFNYKKGPAPKSGVVRGKDEDEGYRVAVRWCELNGCRPPAKVFPMILADAAILKTQAQGAAAELPSAVEAASAVTVMETI